MSKKYFVVSDIHSCYDALIKALNEKGFDKDNKAHILIVDGDIFDRGNKPIAVFKFLMSLNKDNLILIRGNHEDLFIDLSMRYPSYIDGCNGTYKTFVSIAKSIVNKNPSYYSYVDFNNWDDILDLVLNSPIYKFIIDSNNFKNYVELGDIIIIHGSLPHTFNIEKLTDEEIWSSSRWDYAYLDCDNAYFKNAFDNGKKIICGHCGTKRIRNDLNLMYNEEDAHSILKLCNDKLYCIDGNAFYSNHLNVLVIEEVDNKYIICE